MKYINKLINIAQLIRCLSNSYNRRYWGWELIKIVEIRLSSLRRTDTFGPKIKEDESYFFKLLAFQLLLELKVNNPGTILFELIENKSHYA